MGGRHQHVPPLQSPRAARADPGPALRRRPRRRGPAMEPVAGSGRWACRVRVALEVRRQRSGSIAARPPTQRRRRASSAIDGADARPARSDEASSCSPSSSTSSGASSTPALTSRRPSSRWRRRTTPPIASTAALVRWCCSRRSPASSARRRMVRRREVDDLRGLDAPHPVRVGRQAVEQLVQRSRIFRDALRVRLLMGIDLGAAVAGGRVPGDQLAGGRPPAQRLLRPGGPGEHRSAACSFDATGGQPSDHRLPPRSLVVLTAGPAPRCSPQRGAPAAASAYPSRASSRCAARPTGHRAVGPGGHTLHPTGAATPVRGAGRGRPPGEPSWPPPRRRSPPPPSWSCRPGR